MKTILTLSAMLLLTSASALAGSGYDACVKAEKELKARETAECSGLRYLLNPSACYATQKALREYKGGKCRQIGIAENVDFSAPTAIPEKKGSKAETNHRPAPVSAATAPPATDLAPPPPPDKRGQPETARQDTTADQLKEENARLRAEIIRLRTENDQLRKTGR